MKRVMLLSGIVAMVALLAPTSSFGARFGERMDLFNPSNSVPSHFCKPFAGQLCTRVAVAYDHPIKHNPRSPITGTITRIKLRAGAPGSFRLQLARASGKQAKIVRSGRRISYLGGDYLPRGPEVFRVHMHVNFGEYLAIKTSRTSVLRCKRGSAKSLIYEPPLRLGFPYRTASASSSCVLMMLAVAHR